LSVQCNNRKISKSARVHRHMMRSEVNLRNILIYSLLQKDEWPGRLEATHFINHFGGHAIGTWQQLTQHFMVDKNT